VLERSSHLPKTMVLDVLKAAKELAADGIAAALKAAPANGYELYALFAPALAMAEDVEVFTAVCALLRAVGDGVAPSANVGYSVLSNYALPFMLPLLRSLQSPTKVGLLLSVVYSMVRPDSASHIDAIRMLQNAVNEQDKFLTLLPTLMTMETQGFSDDLIALYVYYCVLAIDLPRPELRAAAVGMLVAIAVENMRPVLALLPKLDTLASEGWWEVHGQLGRLCGALLAPERKAELADENATVVVVQLCAKVLANRQPAAQMVVLSSVSPCLYEYPNLLQPFVHSLLELPSEQRLALLDSHELTLAKAGGEVLTVPTLPTTWPGMLVAQALMATARERNMDTLEVSYVEVLSALLPRAAESERDEWAKFLKDNKDYLYIGLCDEELCSPVSSDCLMPLFVLLQDECLASWSTLLATLRIVCEKAPIACTKVATTFLLDLLALGEPFANALRTMVSNFDDPMKVRFVEVVTQLEQ